MLEEKNDNLQDADGNQENVSNQELEQTSENTENIETVETVLESTENKEVVSDENQKAIDEIDSSNAEESEDETLSERHDIPMLDYEKMSMEELTEELEKLVNTGKISSIKENESKVLTFY